MVNVFVVSPFHVWAVSAPAPSTGYEPSDSGASSLLSSERRGLEVEAQDMHWLSIHPNLVPVSETGTGPSTPIH